jgi:hypothetical protein
MASKGPFMEDTISVTPSLEMVAPKEEGTEEMFDLVLRILGY